METNATEGKIKGPCSWSSSGNELDSFRKVVQEVKDEKKKCSSTDSTKNKLSPYLSQEYPCIGRPWGLQSAAI